MRAVTLGLIVFALGLAVSALVASPRAGARATAGSISGSVGPGFSISMSESSVAAGDYTINVNDSSSAHNFHFFGPGVDKKTSIAGTGSTSWSVTLTAGTYSFQCDAHAGTMNGSLTVTDASTTSTDTTTTATTATTTTAHTTTTTTHTTTQHTTTEQTTTEATTSEATTTTAAATTTAPATTSTVATTTVAAKPKPLKARVTAAHATPTAVSVTVASNEHGRALAQLFSGSHRVAKATGRVPGKLVLRPAKPLKAGRYVLKLRVTAGGKTSTSSRTIRIR